MPDGDNEFILNKKIDLVSFRLHLADYIDKYDKMKIPGWFGAAWSPARLAHMLKPYLRPPGREVLANIEKHLRGEDYAPLKDFGEARQSELDTIDRAIMFLEFGDSLLKELGQESGINPQEIFPACFVAQARAKSVANMEFSRASAHELKVLIERAELHGWFWRLLMCLDQYFQGRVAFLAELVGWADFKGPELTAEEKSGLRSGGITEPVRKIFRWLVDTASKLSEPLPKRPPGPPPSNITINYRFIGQDLAKPVERICLALPQVRGFHAICNEIKDNNGTRRGYTDPKTGELISIDPSNIPEYRNAFAACRFGAVLAEENYKQAIAALVNQDGPRTLYIIALPEYYFPRYLAGGEDFITRLQHNLPNDHDLIFISGLEGDKADQSDGKQDKKLSKAIVAYSYSSCFEAYIIGHDEMLVFLNTPLGVIGISTYGYLRSLENFETGLNYVLKKIGCHLQYLFVCFMNNGRAQQRDTRKFLNDHILHRLGRTKLVVTDHDGGDTGLTPGQCSENHSDVYSQDGVCGNFESVGYTLYECELFSKVFTDL